ncbi:hypothetical protein DFH11DRAFT_1500382 [Phellopilus nigrolimitatus]|nr:hypothetical protein DFH11DRAFT_1500382 [Phellopilus nigrolimitatus]
MSLTRQLEEIQLLTCSLLPSEAFALALPPDDRDEWQALMCDYAELLEPAQGRDAGWWPAAACRFEVRIRDVPLWFEVELPREYPEHDAPAVYVRGDAIDRAEQERWQTIVRDKLAELKAEETEYLVQNLFSLILLPLLHQDASKLKFHQAPDPSPEFIQPHAEEPTYHALLTSHHLLAPSKRRSLQKWSAELSLVGFAKLGHPGCIYAEGGRADVAAFVARVKALQWLALRVRFVEPLAPGGFGRLADAPPGGARWTELEKVGEVVEYMRAVGRGEFVTEMGLGSAGSAPTT